MSIGYYGLTRGYAFFDDELFPEGAPDGHHARFHGVVGLDPVEELTLLARLHGFARDDGRSLYRVECEHRSHELTRPQQAVVVIERGFQMNGAGRSIDGVVDYRQ